MQEVGTGNGRTAEGRRQWEFGQGEGGKGEKLQYIKNCKTTNVKVYNVGTVAPDQDESLVLFRMITLYLQYINCTYSK